MGTGPLISWWIDGHGPFGFDKSGTVYVCEGDEGDMIRTSTTNVNLALALIDLLNKYGCTRKRADEILMSIQ